MAVCKPFINRNTDPNEHGELNNNADDNGYFDDLVNPNFDNPNNIIELEKDRLQINTDVFEGTVNVGIAQVTGVSFTPINRNPPASVFKSHQACMNSRIHGKNHANKDWTVETEIRQWSRVLRAGKC